MPTRQGETGNEAGAQAPLDRAWAMLRDRSAGYGTKRMARMARIMAGALWLGAVPALAEQPTPARFFHIQDVTAKIDAGLKPDAAAPVRLAAHVNGDIMSDVPLRGSLPQIGEEPFGLFGFRAPEGQLWRKWSALSNEMASEESLVALCRADPEDCTPAAKRFITMSESVKSQAGLAQLHEVNRRVNAAIVYASDTAQHGQADRWSAPLASLTSGRGDCEDYAIAKYALLREAGFPLADLRLLLVRDRLARDDHAVLAARLDGRWLILDNRFAAIPEDTRMYNFTPLFTLDQHGVKLTAAPHASVPIVTEPRPAISETEKLPLRGMPMDDIASAATITSFPL